MIINITREELEEIRVLLEQGKVAEAQKKILDILDGHLKERV